MRIKHKVRLRIGEDTAMKNILYGEDDDLAEVILDGYTKSFGGRIAIDAGESLSLAFGDVDAVKGIKLKVDADVTVKLNGSADALQLRRGSTATGTLAQLFVEADLSAVIVTAPLTTDVTGTYCVWGDPAV